jgi:hypothetical protein
MQENTNSVVRTFPNYEDKIALLFDTDTNFRELCKDFIFCACNVLEMKTDINTYRADIEEYEHLRRHLEQDILQVISGKE